MNGDADHRVPKYSQSITTSPDHSSDERHHEKNQGFVVLVRKTREIMNDNRTDEGLPDPKITLRKWFGM